MRPDEVGVATPNLNALAAHGVRFANCYSASPLCMPSRTSMVTGKYPSQHGVCGNMSEPVGAAERGDAYPRHLQEAGYHTAYIGKHHYLDRYNLNLDLTDDDDEVREFGYDHVCQVGDVVEGTANDDAYTKWLAQRDKLDEYRRELGQDYFESMVPAETVDGYICETALGYIRDYDEDRPMLLTVGIVGPHPPYWAPGKYATMFSPEDVAPPKGVTDPGEIERIRVMRARKLGKVAMIDDYVRRLLAALSEKGMSENTVVVFTADHGDNIGDYGIVDKRFYYEQSVKVPLVMAGPGVSVDSRAPANIAKALASGIDLYPTLLDLAGVADVKGASRRFGTSLIEVLRGDVPRSKEVFSELGTSMMVRDANWKLVYDHEQGGVQFLFNLRHDPDELENLAGDPRYRPVEATLLENLLTHMVRLTRNTNTKEETNVQRVRV